MTNGTVSVCCLGLGLRASFREMSEARRNGLNVLNRVSKIGILSYNG